VVVVLNGAAPVNPQRQSLFFEPGPEEAGALRRTEPLVDGSRRLNRGSVDSPVKEEHHEHGKEEGTHGGVDHVTLESSIDFHI
jgi:hypothetical protein